MALVFGKLPTRSDSKRGIMSWFGDDNGKYVECRVTVLALTRRCGAQGIADGELHRAFKTNRAKIEARAQNKYVARDVKFERDRTVIVLDVADL